MLGNLHRDTIAESLTREGSPWRDVEVHASCGSTNAELLRDPRPWRAVVADEQVSGRGRLDRSWSTPPGVALAVSASLPLPEDASRVAWLSPVTAMAMTAALTEVTGVRAGWKWPNDILAARADGGPVTADGSSWGKLCGILGQVSSASTVVMGVGVNLAQGLDALPVPTATSVAACGNRLDAGVRDALVAVFLSRLAELHAAVIGPGGVAPVAAEYRRGCLTLGQEVRVMLPDGGQLTGQAVGVDEGARLVVEHPGGTTALAAGDVVHVRRADGGYASGE